VCAKPGTSQQALLPLNIAVIIVNYNAGEQLRACVESVLLQTLQPRRIIVVDNASSDTSMAFLSDANSLITVVNNADNLGFAVANNQAAQMANDCQWLALLNPDAVAHADWLAQLAAGVERYPQAMSFASRMMLLGSDGVLDGAGDEYHFSGAAWRRFHHVDLAQVAALQDELVFGACGGAAFYRRDVFLDMGGFDSSFFCYMEDVDFAFRLQLRGYSCWYLHQAVVDHLGGGTSEPGSHFADYHGHRNLVWAWVKNMPLPLLLLLWPAHLLVNVLMVVQKSRSGKGRTVLRAKWDALLGLPAQIAKRHDIQAQRTVSLGQLLGVMSKSLKR
jgi:GT2 family glycosyltransferase